VRHIGNLFPFPRSEDRPNERCCSSVYSPIEDSPVRYLLGSNPPASVVVNFLTVTTPTDRTVTAPKAAPNARAAEKDSSPETTGAGAFTRIKDCSLPSWRDCEVGLSDEKEV
jgi:hypothetical protein